jgi:hypothetical protein
MGEPYHKILPDSVHGKDIKSIIREMLKEELSLTIKKKNDQIIIEMKLDGEAIGNSIGISLRSL